MCQSCNDMGRAPIKRYRVWFRDGAAVFVKADSRIAAAARAKVLAREQGGDTYIERIELVEGNSTPSA